MTVEELRYGIIGSLALLELLKAKRGEIPEASIAEYRKSVEPEVAAFEALIRAEGAEQGERRERRRLKATRERVYQGVLSIHEVRYLLIPEKAFRVRASVLAPEVKP